MKWKYDEEYKTWNYKSFWILKENSKFILEYKDIKISFKNLNSAKKVAELIRKG